MHDSNCSARRLIAGVLAAAGFMLPALVGLAGLAVAGGRFNA